ncbi:MAG TPA: nucleotidyltransferase domain-containing protein [Thermoanaerobaculia bacterium]|nr:nucleotidyltransferase domain-containing protein [Thermoanaerobaculia bacterium]
MNEQVKDFLEQGAALLKAAGAREVYIFGSVAEGRAREGSDIDLAVVGLPPGVFFTTMARLADLFDRVVDLVDLDEASPFTTYLRSKGLLQCVA